MVCKTVATKQGCPHVRAVICVVLLGATSSPSSAGADPLRLRADAMAETSSPVGLVALQGQDGARPWLDVEGLVWAGARPYRSADATADVLVLTLHLKAPGGWGEMRGGRFVFTSGAIRPVQVDGVAALVRAPWGSTVEAFGGAPVVPSFGARAYDWVAGGRIAQSIASRMTVGASYVQRREHGEISDDEVGADLATVPAPWLDLAARGAYDLASPGITDAVLSAAARSGGLRLEVFAAHRSPARLLPATSLFSVLGDFPSSTAGATLRWQAAPRLDVLLSGAGQRAADTWGGNAWLRALLRLDDRGDGSIGVEARRQDVSTARWTGMRVTVSEPLGAHLRASTELEIASPDIPRGRGDVWPWGLAALSWSPRPGWAVAGAVEAASTPEHRYEVDGLLRLSWALERR